MPQRPRSAAKLRTRLSVPALQIATAVCVAVLLAACTSTGDGETTAREPEPSRPLRVWTVNIEHLLPEHNWRLLFERMDATDTAPDVLFVQELSEPEARTFARGFRRHFAGADSTYAYRHASRGDTLIAWRRTRFRLAHEQTSPEPDDNVVQWAPWSTPDCDGRDPRLLEGVIALRLWDALEEKPVVATSVHFGRGYAQPCMAKNVASLDTLLERKWPQRALTLLAGDFNSHPDTRGSLEPPREPLSTGRQEDPDCWYRTLSAADDNELLHRRDREDDRDCTNDPYYVDALDAYFDAVAVATAPSLSLEICRQWTSIHGGATHGSACTDTDGDGLRDRGRIDYIWVRWENADGDPVRTPVDAARLIAEATADLLCITERCADRRYSDHRGVSALIAWP